MNETTSYIPPKVWSWDAPSGGHFANINRPTAGPAFDAELPVGGHPLQLYSMATSNGVKVTLMLEELLEAGHEGAEYDAWLIDINRGTQFGSGFVSVNPNSKIPGLLDRGTQTPHVCSNPVRSCYILLTKSTPSCHLRYALKS
jgi:GST-like protein